MAAPKFVLKPSIVLEGSPGDQGYVVFDSHSAAMFSCNETGRLLLECLKAGMTQAQLAEAIAREYAVAQEVADRDAGQFVRHLGLAGMLDERA
jgi:hypothetical protein